MKVIVIIPTTGDKKVLDAIESVENQTYKDTSYLVVVDGNKFKQQAYDLFLKSNITDKNICVLPQNTGENGFYGHRIYAGFPHLVNEDIILFLDQDNWYSPEHVTSLVDIIKSKNLMWAYSLRNIYDKNDNFLCRDDCESLGKWSVWNNTNSFHIDTSAYAFRREFLIQVSSLWHSGYAGDRRFFNLIRTLSNITYDTSGIYSLNYRLDGNINSASPEFFIYGNNVMQQKYNNFPWRNND